MYCTVCPYHVTYTFQSESTLKRVRGMIRICSQMHRTDKYSKHSPNIWPVWLNGWVFLYELSGCEFASHCSHLLHLYLYTYIPPVSSKKFLDIQATIELGFTLKRVRDMIRTYSQIYFSLLYRFSLFYPYHITIK